MENYLQNQAQSLADQILNACQRKIEPKAEAPQEPSELAQIQEEQEIQEEPALVNQKYPCF